MVDEQTGDRMTSGEINALLTSRIEAHNIHDASALAATYASDCIVETVLAGTIYGRAAAEGMFRHWFTAFPDFTLSSDEILSVGNRAVQCLTGRGTDTGGLLGQAPTGKPFQLQFVALFTLKDRLIAHERRVWDLYGLMAQLAGTQSLNTAENANVYRATLERARIERELKVAADIQRALLPELARKASGFEVAAASAPCRAIGGDFFDYYDQPTGAFGFCLGDVAGKGPAAALLAAECQGILGLAQSNLAGTPADVIASLNRVLMRRAVAARFATVVYGLLNRDGRFTYCNAGHNPPLLMCQEGVRRLTTGGPVVGAFENVRYEEATLQLYPNDVLVVFSDGITEALDPAGIEFGDNRLLASVEANRALPPQSLLEHLLDDVRQFTAIDIRHDDQTALILRYSGA